MTTLTLPDELVKQIYEVAGQRNQTVEEMLQQWVRESVEPDAASAYSPSAAALLKLAEQAEAMQDTADFSDTRSPSVRSLDPLVGMIQVPLRNQIDVVYADDALHDILRKRLGYEDSSGQ